MHSRRSWGMWVAGCALLGALACGLQPARANRSQEVPEMKHIEHEARQFVRRLQAGKIAAMSDEDVVEAFEDLDPEVLASYLEMGGQAYGEYELWMSREERLGGQWPDKPFLNHIKYKHQPRKVYMKWLKGGANAGQEIIYDETRRKDQMYGHLGGLFNVASVWTSVTGSMARANSNHTIADLGVQAIFGIVAAERAQYLAEGRRPFPDRIEVATVAGQRTVALTWVAPSRKHYAHKTRVYLDLDRPMVRGIEAWNESGEQTERIILQKIVPATFTDADFDPANKAYAF